MKSAFCLLLPAFSLAAQPISGNQADAAAARKLNSTLLTLKGGTSREAVGRQLAADLASVSDPDHRPSRPNLVRVAEGLAAALDPAKLRPELLSHVTIPIVEVLHSAGTSTVGFYETVKRAEIGLTELGVAPPEPKRISESLMTLGKQVRGPEDFPVQ